MKLSRSEYLTLVYEEAYDRFANSMSSWKADRKSVEVVK